jgi:hypothetical protein
VRRAFNIIRYGFQRPVDIAALYADAFTLRRGVVTRHAERRHYALRAMLRRRL